MSDTTDTSDSWGQQLIDCLIRKAKISFNPGNLIAEKHILIDQIESNAVEDASKNLDSFKEEQRSTNETVMIQRTKQINQKDDNTITDKLSERKYAQVFEIFEDFVSARMNKTKKVNEKVVKPKVIIDEKKVKLSNHISKVKDDSVKRSLDDCPDEMRAPIIDKDLSDKNTKIDIPVDKAKKKK